jgi:hypothetical protein
MRAKRRIILTAFCIMGMTAPRALAQQQGQETQPDQQTKPDQAAAPVPAYRSPLASAADNGDDEGLIADPHKLIPDSRSLTGAQAFSLGEPATVHSYWQPRVIFTSTASSNGLSSTSNSGWTSFSTIFGGIDLHRISGNSNLSLSYSGGYSVSNDGSSNNGVIQNLGFADSMVFRRTTLSFYDQLNYLPENSFGSQFGSIGTPIGSGSIGFLPGLGTGQSILTASGQQLDNSFVPEVDVKLTPRTSLTFVGIYSVLHFFDNDLLNSYSAGGRVGYNHELTRKDTIGLSYGFTAYRYSNYNQSINTHVVYVSYGRRVTGKLAFQVAVGPQYILFETPITSTGNTGTGTALSSTSQLSWALYTSLTYQLRRATIGLSYSHGVNGGSGVQAGSIADTVTGSASRQLSRTFSGIWNISYARNSGLTVNAPGTTTPNQTFNYWSNNLGLTHQMGRTMTLGLYYLLQYQTSSSSFCVGPTCGSSYVLNQVLVSLGWHEHPLRF